METSRDMTYMSTDELIEVAVKLSEQFNKGSDSRLQELSNLCKATLEQQKQQEARLDALQQEVRRINKLQIKMIPGVTKGPG